MRQQILIRAVTEQHIPEGQGAGRRPAAGVCEAQAPGDSAWLENHLPSVTLGPA